MLETSSPSDSLVRFEREKRILYHGKGVLFGCYGNSNLPYSSHSSISFMVKKVMIRVDLL